MIFSLDVRRARKGDCLLLHFGPEDDPGLVLIDGGPSSVYKPHLRPRLVEIREARGLDPQTPLTADLLMVSHVDDDHIRGILDLTRELIEAQGARAPLLRMLSFWHNSFDDVIGNDPGELTAAVRGQFGAASLSGGLPADATVESAQEDEEVVRASLSVLASIEQGHRLRDDIISKLGLPLNPQFDKGLITAGKREIPVGQGLTFIVAGPMKPELLALQKKHDDWLEAQRKKERTNEEALAAYVDRSVPNLSSVVVMAKVADKSMLLTGDARGDKILEGLELAGLLEPGGRVHVDVLKAPHHGSSNNVESDFFERITADHYVFSGNGEHGNPERETMQMLLGARGRDPFEIHLTYPVVEIDEARKEDWEKEQQKEKRRRARGGTKEPREDWSAAKHGLEAFFEDQRLAPGQTIRVVDENEPHVIDLLDRLGY